MIGCGRVGAHIAAQPAGDTARVLADLGTTGTRPGANSIPAGAKRWL